MTEFTDEEISKMDEILKFLDENKKYIFDERFLSKKFELSLEEYKFYYSKIVEFSQNEFSIGNILDANSRYPSIACNFSTERFIQRGGFKNFYLLNKEKELKQSTGNINNIFNGPINDSRIDIDNSSHKQIDKTTTNFYDEIKRNKLSEIIAKYWWQLLVPLALIIIGLVIEKYYFK